MDPATYRLFMLSKRSMNDTAIKENLGGIRDSVERLQCLVELVVVVGGKGCHPGLDFLPRVQQL